jgi:hypothetical protein
MLLTAGGNTLAAEPPGSSLNTKGLTVLIIGHSLTHCLRALEPLAPMVGHSGHQQMLYTILGAGIAYHYQMETNQWTPVSWRKLYFGPDKKWDALIMSARDAHWKGPKEISSDEEFAPKFALEAFKSNPRCQIFIYGNWPSVTDDFDKPSFAYTDEYLERVGAAVDNAFPNAPKARVMPCMRLMRELAHMADRGELPGVTSRFALFSDGVHPGRFTAYALNMLVMAMLYNESPAAYPSEIYPGDSQGRPVRGDVFTDVRVPAETATVIKRVVWDILQTYPPAGMPPSLVIANRRLEPVVAGQPYKAELKALNAAGPCMWAIAKGRLPQGVSFSAQGVLAGRSSAVGDYPLTIRLTDGKSSFERPLVVSINQGTPPLIPNQPLGTVSLDQYVLQPLKMEGGVGHITWNINGGKLPYGIRLSPAGVLVGSPGEQGRFAFKIKIEDTFPSGARSAEESFTWMIGPASPGALLVKSLVVSSKTDDKIIVVDGKLDEPFWKLDQTIARKVKGAPTKQASFGVVWTHESRAGVKQFGRDLVLAVKVLDGPKGKTPKDGIHIFIDGNHNQSVSYSGDDTHFFVPRNHKGDWAQSLRGKVNWFTNAKVQEVERGYTMEISLGATYFTGEGNWLSFGAKGVYGFDVAVDEGDDKEISQQVWRGDANESEDTSHFGTIVLMDEPAVTAPSKP